MTIKIIPSFWINGETVSVGWLESGPVAEMTASATEAAQAQPLIYALGPSAAVAPLVDIPGWETRPVPFYYRVVRPREFFLSASYLRRTVPLKMAMDFVAVSGIGHVVMWLWQGRLPKAEKYAGVEITPVEAFGPWVDYIWQASRTNLSLAAVRDANTLGLMYPADAQAFLKLKVVREGKPLGWFVILGKQWKNHPQFGRMRIGSIADGLALPGEEDACYGAVMRFLCNLEIDLIVSHHSNAAYGEAHTVNGMRSGPSNMMLALSPELAKRVEPVDDNAPRFFFNRGDGAGPLQG